MALTCVRYQRRTGDSLRGVADLEFWIPEVGAMEIKDLQFTSREESFSLTRRLLSTPVA